MNPFSCLTFNLFTAKFWRVPSSSPLNCYYYICFVAPFNILWIIMDGNVILFFFVTFYDLLLIINNFKNKIYKNSKNFFRRFTDTLVKFWIVFPLEPVVYHLVLMTTNSLLICYLSQYIFVPLHLFFILTDLAENVIHFLKSYVFFIF